MGSRIRSFVRLGGALASLALAGGSLGAQQDPVCLQPNSDLDHVSYWWGGEVRHVFQRQVGSARRVWTAEDGGRIRYSWDGGATWSFAETPLPGPAETPLDQTGATQALLDVYFLADGETGWACGVGGRILKLTDGGATWQHLDPSQPALYVEQPEAGGLMAPATLWRVRFLDESLGFVAGLWTFKMTRDGGQTWCDVEMYQDQSKAAPGQQYFALNHEFHALEVIGTPSWFVCNVAGQAWEGHMSLENHQARVFHTESLSSDSSGTAACGAAPVYRFWKTFDAESLTLGFDDAWDMEFEALTGFQMPEAHPGYLVGGTGNAMGFLFRTANSGRTWTQEFAGLGQPATCFGVAALSGGNAIAGGYAGQILGRDPVSGAWDDRSVPGHTGSIADVNGHGTGAAWAIGSIGFLRKTETGGLPSGAWETQNAPYEPTGSCALPAPEESWLLEDLIVRNNGNTIEAVASGAQRILVRSEGSCDLGVSSCRWQLVNGDTQADQDFQLYALAAVGGTSNTVVAVGDGSSAAGHSPVMRSADFGATWTNLAAAAVPSRDVVLRDVAYSPRTGDAAFIAVGQDAAGLPIVWKAADGSSWTAVALPPELGTAAVQLRALAFARDGDGFVVGSNGSSALAYVIRRVGGGSTSFTKVCFVEPTAPLHPDFCLFDVAVRGTSLVSAEAYAVGAHGMWLRWYPSLGRFDDHAPYYDITDTATGAATGWYVSESAELELSAVAMAASGVIVAPSTSNAEPNSNLLGALAHHDGASWKVRKCQTSKRVRAIAFLPSGNAVLLARSENDEIESEFGNVNDTSFLYFDRTPGP